MIHLNVKHKGGRHILQFAIHESLQFHEGDKVRSMLNKVAEDLNLALEEIRKMDEKGNFWESRLLKTTVCIWALHIIWPQ